MNESLVHAVRLILLWGGKHTYYENFITNQTSSSAELTSFRYTFMHRIISIEKNLIGNLESSANYRRKIC